MAGVCLTWGTGTALIVTLGERPSYFCGTIYIVVSLASALSSLDTKPEADGTWL